MKYCKNCMNSKVGSNVILLYSCVSDSLKKLFNEDKELREKGCSLLMFLSYDCDCCIYLTMNEEKNFNEFLDKNRADFWKKRKSLTEYYYSPKGAKLLEEYFKDKKVFSDKSCKYYFERKVEENE